VAKISIFLNMFFFRSVLLKEHRVIWYVPYIQVISTAKIRLVINKMFTSRVARLDLTLLWN